ncbi:helix-turn-helix domain-containing protein [uncultured Enterococcus sp.]|uniref:helix-turn-helix domain-containing protein n=1 Tax=uncultured Enterococcus sp. TaxID=167972 RepID=UPI002AA6D9D2|nr:helix-turn-helix domain-containing protein [uncultured Enterococcus sp.]
MLDRKKVLGSKIKKLREEKKLSRGELCGGEEELTVRQLARIEAGESLPTLPKIEYIAEQLSVSVASLVDRKYVELPKRYLQLKHKLARYYTFREKERIIEKEQLFDKIYKEYYDELPEEEQLAIDIQRITTDVFLTEDFIFGEGILKDYFSQVKRKQVYSVNDLLIIELYFFHIHEETKYDEDVFLTLFQNLSKQIDNAVDIEQFLLTRLFVLSVGVFMEHNNYDRIIKVVAIINKVMRANQDFQKKPIIDMYEGKYWLFAQQDSLKAKEKYTEGSKFADMMGDYVLSEKIMEEWELDLQEFQRRG